jgi:hypothetical protein
MANAINFALMRIGRRAEGAEPAMLAETFVDVGPLFTLLRSRDHQILYGRRGTGKTHALKYLGQDVGNDGDMVVYVDMRTIGSNASIYGDPSVPVSERGTRLLVDTLGFLYNELVDRTLELAEREAFEYALSLRKLDELANEITQVAVEGEVEREATDARRAQTEGEGSVGMAAGTSLQLSARVASAERTEDRAETRILERGSYRLHVNFGSVQQLLSDFVEAVPSDRVWVLLDEWSQVPLDLQPLLGDLIRRCLFPVSGLTVKIGAVEQMSRFRVPLAEGGYLGIEVGADASADVDLDDFMVFGNDPERAKAFFKQLLHRHVRATLAAEGRQDEAPRSADGLVRQGFTQENAFEELVRAAEGVPRDAINVANLAAQAADDNLISVSVIRSSARTWYLRDKEKDLSSNPAASDLLHAIQDDVIGQRRARAFFLNQADADNPLIVSLYNARVLHVIKRGVASYVEPGVRFDVYAIDYGAYVHLHSTQRNPLGLFEVETEEGSTYAEVPADDYRSIRRAILRLEEFRDLYGARDDQASPMPVVPMLPSASGGPGTGE